MPPPDQTGYLLLTQAVDDNDEPTDDPAALAERVYDALYAAGLIGFGRALVEVRPAYTPDGSAHFPYGTGIL